MADAVLNVRTDRRLKKDAAKVAESLGFTLSSVVNAYLRRLVKTRRVDFAESYEPTPYLARIIRQAEKDIKERKNLSPAFDNAKDAIAWLKKQR